MIWLTLRQHRNELVIVGGVIVALAILLIISGVAMHQDFDQLGVGACLRNAEARPACGDVINAFTTTYDPWRVTISWLNLLPMLYGVLIGVPLVGREFEQRTNFLAWTQGITKRRWLLAKIGIALAVTLVFTGVLVTTLTWWNGPYDQIQGHFPLTSFDFEGIAPFGYAVFSLALGITAGALLRRTIPATAVALLGYLPLRLWVDGWLRQRYMPPRSVIDTGNVTTTRFDWILGVSWVDGHGKAVSDFTTISTCSGAANKQGFFQCFTDHGWLQAIVYQPANRYWPFQGIEAALFSGIGIVLLGLTVWWVGYRSN